jgi:hypothetical protein
VKRTPGRKTAAITKASIANRENALFTRVAAILDEARSHIVRTRLRQHVLRELAKREA